MSEAQQEAQWEWFLDEGEDELKEFVTLPSYEPVDEQSHEKFFEALAEHARRFGLCDRVACFIWSRKLSDSEVPYWQYPDPTKSLAEFSETIAKQLFPYPEFVTTIESQLLRLNQRFSSVSEARDKISQRCRLYLRLCARHNRQTSISDSRMMEVLYSALPQSVERSMRIYRDEVTDLKEFWREARRFEQIEKTYGSNKEDTPPRQVPQKGVRQAGRRGRYPRPSATR